MRIRNTLRLGAAMLLVLAILAGCSRRPSGLPEVPVDPAWAELAAQAAKEYREEGWSCQVYLPEESYDPFGSYLNWEDCRQADFAESDSRHFDEDGCIMARYGQGWVYNPVTTAQWALFLYGRWLAGDEPIDSFYQAARMLADMVEPDGALRYDFGFTYYVDPQNPIQPGWVSAMAQGQALSVFARAYHVSGEKLFAQAGAKVLDFLSVPIEDGGTRTTLAALHPALASYVILEEYPFTPPTYTLNGFQFTAMGLYDWSMAGADTSEQAGALFSRCVDTLEVILPYFDLDDFTCYDLSHLTMDREQPHIGVNYHAYHTAFCRIFYQITGRETFQTYYERWADYVA